MVSNLINTVKKKFLSNYIKLDEDWLSGCIDWVTSDCPGLHADDVYKKAYDQWLLTDLSETGVPCIPERVFQQKDPFSLPGKFILQLNFVIDISESSYDQWRRLNDQKLDEPEPVEEFRTQSSNQGKKQPKRKRLLKLELTDGTRKVDAMEYRPVPCLSTKLFPGTKLLISGPIQCSNGVLLLTQSNVNILGGEVDTLLVPNAFENILLKQLNKPLNPKPRLDYQEAKVAEESQPHVRNHPNRPVVMAQFKKPPPRTGSGVVVPELEQLMNEDDNLLSGMEMETLEAVSTGRPTTPELLEFEREDENLFNDAAMLDEVEMLGPAPNPPEPPPMASTSHAAGDSFQDFVDQALFDEDFLPPPEHRRNPSILDTDYQFRIRGHSLVTIDQLTNILQKQGDSIGDRSFILRGKFHRVVEKLIIKDDYWNIGVLFEDLWSREKLKVRILSVVLNKLTGRTAKELTEMYKCAQGRPNIKEEIQEILEMLKEKIRKVDCYLKIDYSTDFPCPSLVELIDAAPVLNNILRMKVQSENLTSVQ
uniref:RecQ-mediated genome instability protein 1 n=2 Tax=Lutzomyia longipalpis TaxID=7200 RepID=A0A1B0CL91_LUTLO